MGFIKSCTEENKVWLEGMKKTPNIRYANILYNGGIIGWTSLPARIIDYVYTGEYEWRGLDQNTANQQVELLNNGTGSIGGDGSSGLQLTINVPEISGDPVTITYKKETITMGSASAKPAGGCFWSVHVGINYKITTIELLQK